MQPDRVPRQHDARPGGRRGGARRGAARRRHRRRRPRRVRARAGRASRAARSSRTSCCCRIWARRPSRRAPRWPSSPRGTPSRCCAARRRSPPSPERRSPARAASAIVPRAMRVGVAKEIKAQEYRVALTPAGALELVQRGHEVLVERGAGAGSAFPDEAYVAAGARLASVDEVWGEAELLLKVKEPIEPEYRAPARRARALHVPPHRRRRAADASARRLGRHRDRLRDGRDRRPPPAAARADERGRRPARAADGRVGAREGARRARHPAQRPARACRRPRSSCSAAASSGSTRR